MATATETFAGEQAAPTQAGMQGSKATRVSLRSPLIAYAVAMGLSAMVWSGVAKLLLG